MPVEILPFETQSQQGFLYIGVVIDLLYGIEFLAQGRDPLDQLHITIRLIVRTSLQLLIQFGDLRLHLVQMGESLRRLLENGTAILRHQMLRQISDHGIFRGGHFSTAWLPHAGQYLQQGRFTSTVFAHQSDTIFLVNHKRNIREKGASTKLYC